MADLAVVSACLQDALILVDDMLFLPEERRFVAVANRFCWEAPRDQDGCYRRTTAGIEFDDVSGVKRRGFDRHAGDRILSLLAVQAAPDGIELTFSGGSALLVETGSISIRLQDIGEAWPTKWYPLHDAGQSDQR
jgi:hypothetical protein